MLNLWPSCLSGPWSWGYRFEAQELFGISLTLSSSRRIVAAPVSLENIHFVSARPPTKARHGQPLSCSMVYWADVVESAAFHCVHLLRPLFLPTGPQSSRAGTASAPIYSFRSTLQNFRIFVDCICDFCILWRSGFSCRTTQLCSIGSLSAPRVPFLPVCTHCYLLVLFCSCQLLLFSLPILHSRSPPLGQWSSHASLGSPHLWTDLLALLLLSRQPFAPPRQWLASLKHIRR